MVKKMSAMLLLFSCLVWLSFSVAAQSVTPGCPPSFGPAHNESVTLGNAHSVLVDFDGDGQLDVVSVDAEGIPSTRFRREDGFSAPVVSSYMQGIYHPLAIAVGYFDGDYIDGQFVVNPWPDIAVATAEGGVYLLTSDPYGYYSFRGTPVLQGLYVALAAVDFNEDGMSDIMAVDATGGSILQFSQSDGNWGNAAYSPTTAEAYGSGEVPVAATLGYFDGVLQDGQFFPNDLPDLAVLTSEGRVLLYTTDADGYFTVRETDLGGIFAEIRSADFNQDGRSDLLAKDAAGNTYLLLRNENGDFNPAQAVGSDPVASLIGGQDLSGDGMPDIVVTMGDDAHLAWLSGTVNCLRVA
ncbi:MAG: VCBS repeat-containing protein [Blastocatellia bacterium]